VSPRPRVAPLRRDQIIRATIRCLAREGYANLTMKKLAREAGVRSGILHYYFPSKRAILLAALERVMGDLDRRVVRHARGSRDPRERLRALIGTCLSVAVDAREFWIVFVEFWGEMMHDRSLLRVNARLYARFRRVIGELVASGVRRGQFRRVDPEEAGAVILALADGLSLQLTFDPRALTLEQATRLGEDAAMRYLAKR
jgi:AcrR family transcriptional regulator